MTTYSAISGASVAVGAIPSSATVTALRDNPIAIAEAASSAPIVAAGWHPTTKVTIGDGIDGIIYDWTVSGAVASVTTPDFADGWEYRLTCLDMQPSVNARLQVSAYFATDAVYRRIWYTPAYGAGQYGGCDIEFILPRVSSRGHIYKPQGHADTAGVGEAYIENNYDSTVQKILRAQVTFDAGNIDEGKIYLFRRRCYASSP
jgi:hypothetical protein